MTPMSRTAAATSIGAHLGLERAAEAQVSEIEPVTAERMRGET